jgi:GntR family transcriptional regulator/MocR family aminotransferase
MRSVAGTLFGSINLKRGDPGFLHTQLYSSLRELILDGALKSEQRLPSSRVLAEELSISRTTVLTVYDRLNSEGLLYSKTGAGSFVSSILKQRQLALDGAQAVERVQAVEGSFVSSILKQRQLALDGAQAAERVKAVGSPPLSRAFQDMCQRLPVRVEISNPQAFSTAIPAIDIFPMDLWSRIISRYSRRRDLVRYISSKGYAPLLDAIAAHLRTERGLECRPEQVNITSGAQQAFNFLAGLLLDPGDAVWFENPGSRIARNS